jgi:hypothetical protein
MAQLVVYARYRTERAMQHNYSDKKLEPDNMPISQRCNYAGPHGNLIPTRSLAYSLGLRLRELVLSLRRHR